MFIIYWFCMRQLWYYCTLKHASECFDRRSSCYISRITLRAIDNASVYVHVKYKKIEPFEFDASISPYRTTAESGSHAYRMKIMENHFRNCCHGFYGSCARCTRVYGIIKLRHSVSAAVPVWLLVTSRPQNVVLPSSHVSLVRSFMFNIFGWSPFSGKKRKYSVDLFLDDL